MNIALVIGTFDEKGGKPSYFGSKMVEYLKLKEGEDLNGGNLSDVMNFDPSGLDVLIWMPNIDNSEDKILPKLKKKNQKMILVSSKRCIENEYNEFDVVSRLLKTRSNLGIMIEKNGKYNFKLLDPLGNQFCDTPDLGALCQSLLSRSRSLIKVKRMGCEQKEQEPETFSDSEFVDVVRKYGNEFTKYVNAVNPSRFLGNASVRTRCMSGFPSAKIESKIYVSKRNVDKENMSESDFIRIFNGDKVGYCGSNKPSVDSPIQLGLYTFYTRVKYMIHGHVYVKNAPFTKSKLPCGSLQEINEVAELFPNRREVNFSVNLKGHGCIILAENLEFLHTQMKNLQSRPFPEL